MNTFIRLHVITEGQSEEKFVKDTLAQHLGSFNISTDARSVLTGKQRNKKYRGGLISYEKARKDIYTWLKEDQHNESRFTTMFDLYALPSDFPGNDKAKSVSDPYRKVNYLESAFGENIQDSRFIPYIQLHEFESLLFAQIKKLELEYFEHKSALNSLEVILNEHQNNPELINDNVDTAPSKRIIDLIPEYKNNKVAVGAVIVGLIGIQTLRSRCSHFNSWLESLESLSLLL